MPRTLKLVKGKPGRKATGRQTWKGSEEINAHQKAKASLARDIGDIPEIENKDRREDCRWDFLLDCKTYHAEKFDLPLSKTHEQMAMAIQRAMLETTREIFACPRGTGKTAWCVRGIEWAVRHGHRQWPMLINADESAFKLLMRGFRVTFETKDILLADFPEIVYPIRKLERIGHRVNGQTCRGRPTFMRWGDEIVLPTTYMGDELGTSAGIIKGGGITSAVRGAQITLPDGRIVRPDAVLIEDPQTRESAKSPHQVQERIRIVAGDVMGMAGPGKPMSALMTCTVIENDDMADQMLSGSFPEWQAIRVPFIESWPEHMTLWHEYTDILRMCWAEGRPIDPATSFYEHHRKDMDKGSKVYWEHRIDPPCVSALQTAMNQWIRDPYAFAAEYQNDPHDESEIQDVVYCTAEHIREKTSGLERYQIPQEANVLVAFIDVQLDCLIYVVQAVCPGFKRYVVDYGCYPDQRRDYWTKAALSKRISDTYKSPKDGWLRSLRELALALETRVWYKPDGTPFPLTRGCVDAAYGESTDIVFEFCRTAERWLPAYGVGVTASTNELNHGMEQRSWKKRHVDWGPHWHARHDTGRKSDYLRYDSNFWKAEAHRGLATPEPEDGSITLFAGKHYLFADHCRAEYPVLTQGRGRELSEWKQRKGQDNDLLDGLAAGGMIASSLKVPLPGMESFEGARARRQVRHITAEHVSTSS